MSRTYGTISFNSKDHCWTIQAEPHITLRLKRMFERIDKNQHGKILVKATPENTRDIEWFLQRYDMDVSAGDRKIISQLANQHRDKILRLENIVSGKYEAAEFKLALPPRDYQTVAAEIYLKNNFLLLADDLGTGKTISAICSLCDKRTLPALVVTLTHLPGQWQKQIMKFAPDLETHIVKSTTPYPLPTFLGRNVDVVIMNYHKLAGWAQVLAKYCKSVIFDECQELRHNGSARYGAAEHIARSVDYRIGLSATPIYNYGGEIYNVLNVLQENVLGSREEFEREWCQKNYDKTLIKDPVAFGTYLREQFIMLRRTRKDVDREIPALTKIPHTIECDSKALDRVTGSAAELAKIILTNAETAKGEKMQAAGKLDSLIRQATGISKAPYVADFVRILVENGEKVILFGWHREVYSIWAEKLADLKPVFYTGSETPEQKEQSKQRFIHNYTNLMILSLRAGAGLDGLQDVCRTVVFGELDWSPGVHEQNIGRVHRDGQKDPVTAYFLIADEGADPLMAETLGVKGEQIEGLKNPTQELIEKLEVDPNHIKRLAEQYLKAKAG